MFPKLKIGEFTVRVPIIQGGMGVGISLSGLAAATANEGGIGVISSVGLGLLEKVERKSYRRDNLICLRKEIRKAKALTDGVIGLNVMVAVSDYDDIVKAAIEEEIDILFLGAGLPLKIPEGITLEHLKSVKTKIVPIVSSDRAAKLIFQSWEKKYDYIPDAIVVEGPKAGGHLGFKAEQIDDPNFTLENIIPKVIEILEPFKQRFSKEIPVIAAGGIFDGEDIYKFLAMGAAGVQMGTRFVATNECDADIKFKEQFVNCKEDEIGIIKSPVGLPGRAIINNFLKDVTSGIRMPFSCPWKCLKTCKMKQSLYCIADALMKAKSGNLSNGFSFAGANAYRIKHIVSVKELIETLRVEFEEVVYKMQGKKISFNDWLKLNLI